MTAKKIPSPIYLLMIVATSIFLFEGAIMWILYRFTSLPPQAEGIIDSTLLIITLYPILYFFLYRPMALYITEQKESERKLQEAYDNLRTTQTQLIQAEKMTLLGQLSAGVAHEINNPVAVISGEAQMLFKDDCKDQETKEASRVILEQAKRIEMITRRLLEFSRRKESKQQSVDLNEAIEKSLALLSYQAKVGNVVTIKKLDSSLPKVLGDFDQLQEVFLNLALNAVQAMERGGTLTIRSRRDKVTEDARRKIDILKYDQEIVMVEVEDTGIGMDEVALKKCFDPFFTTKEKGTGLGLSVCYGIVESHGGMIEVRSQLGKGSTFIVKLPVFKEEGGGK